MTSTSGAIRVKAFTATMAPNEKPPGKRVDDLIVHGPLMERMGVEQKPDTARVYILGSLHKTLESTGWSSHHDRVFRVRSQHKVRAAQPNTRRPLNRVDEPTNVLVHVPQQSQTDDRPADQFRKDHQDHEPECGH